MILITGGLGQGKRDYAVKLMEENISNQIISMDDKVLVWVKNGDDVIAETRRLMEDHESAIFIISEVGCGLVPIDVVERAYREACGRAGCEIAAKAEAVYRMVCGIPQRIK